MSEILAEVLHTTRTYAKYSVLAVAAVTLLMLLVAGIRLRIWAGSFFLPIALCGLICLLIIENTRCRRNAAVGRQSFYLSGIAIGTVATLFVFSTSPARLFLEELPSPDVFYVPISTGAALKHELTSKSQGHGEALKLFEDGRIQMREHNYTSAATSYENSSHIVPTASAHLNAGVARLAIGSFERAEDHFAVGLSLARTQRNEIMEAALLDALGSLYNRQGRLQLARDVFERASSIDQRIRNHGGQANALADLSTVLSRTGQIALAFDLARQALRLHEAYGPLSQVIDDHIILAKFYEAQMRRAEATAEVAVARSLADRSGDLLAQGKTYVARALITYANGSSGSDAIKDAQAGLAIFDQMRNPEGQLAALHGIGWILAGSDQNTEALGYFSKALDLAGRSGDLFARAAILDSMASSEAALHNFDSARQLYSEVLMVSKGMGAEALTARALLGLSRLDLDEGHVENAIKSAEQVLNIGEKNQSLADLAEAWQIMGDAQVIMRAIKDARQSFENALRYNKQVGDWRAVAGITLRLQKLGATP